MQPVRVWIAFLSLASFLAQQGQPIEEPLLFPPAKDLVRAAQLGYRSEEGWPPDVAYESRLPGDFQPCRGVIREIRIAGPMLLAVREGQTARLHSEAMPIDEQSLHSMGTLLVELEFFSDQEDERADVALRSRSRVYFPLAKYLKSAEHFYCGQNWYAWRIRESYTFGFAPGQINRDWLRRAELVVIRRGRKESFPLGLETVLTTQLNVVRRKVQ